MSTFNPHHVGIFGPDVIGKDQYEREKVITEVGALSFGPDVIGQEAYDKAVAALNGTGTPAGEQPPAATPPLVRTGDAALTRAAAAAAVVIAAARPTLHAIATEAAGAAIGALRTETITAPNTGATVETTVATATAPQPETPQPTIEPTIEPTASQLEAAVQADEAAARLTARREAFDALPYNALRSIAADPKFALGLAGSPPKLALVEALALLPDAVLATPAAV